MRRLFIAAGAVLACTPGAAWGADPILPFGEVSPGARCTALSVVQGTEITSFDAEIVDVLGAPRLEDARVLVRVSGPAVDTTGIGPGFSGSPVLCPDSEGTARTIGAISEGLGDYGGRLTLVTPIEAMLAQPIRPPGALGTLPAAARTRAITARARPLAAPLTLSGIRPRLAAGFARAARRTGRILYQAPAPAAGAPVPLTIEIRPGSSVSAGLATGDVGLGAIGTATYVDGDDVWAFGHALDTAGRRSLFFQGAVVHAVVSNPIPLPPDVQTYKLASPGAAVGTVTGDGPSAVTARLGEIPAGFPLRVTARDLDTGRSRSLAIRIADEGDVGDPAGVSPLSLVASASVAEVAGAALAGTPSRTHGDQCVAITVRELRKPLRACNSYSIDGPTPGSIGGPLVADVASAAGLLDTYRFGVLHPTDVQIGVRLRRGPGQAFLVGASAPRKVRRGTTIPVRLRLRRARTGQRLVRSFRIRVPRDLPAGARVLRLSGRAADQGSNPEDGGGDLSLVFEDGSEPSQDAGPRTLAALRRAFTRLERYTGMRASFGAGTGSIRAYEDPVLRITGRARIRVLVRR